VEMMLKAIFNMSRSVSACLSRFSSSAIFMDSPSREQLSDFVPIVFSGSAPQLPAKNLYKKRPQ